MKFQIDWSHPVIAEQDVLWIQPTDLSDFYFDASDLDKGNIFFVLLVSFNHYRFENKKVAAAHLCFLMAYYLFILHTPPGSYELATHYIAEAVLMNPLDEYKEWQTLIEKGN